MTQASLDLQFSVPDLGHRLLQMRFLGSKAPGLILPAATTMTCGVVPNVQNWTQLMRGLALIDAPLDLRADVRALYPDETLPGICVEALEPACA